MCTTCGCGTGELRIEGDSEEGPLRLHPFNALHAASVGFQFAWIDRAFSALAGGDASVAGAALVAGGASASGDAALVSDALGDGNAPAASDAALVVNAPVADAPHPS